MKKIKEGSSTLTIDDRELQKMILRVIKESSPVVLETLERVRDEILAAAKKDWPVQTGTSKFGLDGFERVTPTNLSVGIDNPVEYVYYIKANDLGGKSPWQELVIKPLKKRRKEILAETSIEMKKLMEGSK